jgi:hypothetical protein
MNIYQIKYDKYDDTEECEPILLTHNNLMTQQELQKFVQLAINDMKHRFSYESLPYHMEKYGFNKLITAYYK